MSRFEQKLRTTLWGSRALLSLTLVLSSFGCSRSKDEPKPFGPAVEPYDVDTLVPMPKAALEPEFLLRGTLALKKRLGEGAQLLELRATPRAISLQTKVGEVIHEYVYLESDDPKVQGHVEGPRISPLLGQGTIDDNLFSSSELDVIGIGKAFDVARRAVDPEDGVVERLVARRFLPFGEGVRVRIYVASPRMSGSIDTNTNGVPLRR